MCQVSPAENASTQALDEMFTAINHCNSFRLEAGAGAGKTYSLIKALKHLVHSRADEFIKKEQKIACITYTNIAKDEIRERTDNHPVIYADTIHAFSWSFISGFQAKLRELLPELGAKWVARIEEAGGIDKQKVIYDLGFPKIDEKTISLHHDDVIKLISSLLGFSKFQNLLKAKFPIVFIDEYQDTNKDLASSIVNNLIDNDSGLLVGLFGDHWQKIYGKEACGLIESENDNITEIGKNANFRSDKNIVNCLNNMRPELPQHESDPESEGGISIYHSNSWTGERRVGGHWAGDLPEDAAHVYFERVKETMSQNGWDFDSENTKVLMLTNNVIATEQGFKDLSDCFRHTEDYLKKNDPYIKYFVEVIEPVIASFETREYGELFQVINQKFPQLQCHDDKRVWVDNLNRINELRLSGTVDEMLAFLIESNKPRLSNKVRQLEERYQSLLEEDVENLGERDKNFLTKIRSLKSVSYRQVIQLSKFIDDKTPFSTKHGVKGAEFDNVLVVLGRGWNQYNWNQMLEFMENGYPANKKDTFERNRNLFYVACSRAKHNLTLLITQELSVDSINRLRLIFGNARVIGEPNA
ncbi:MAG TPA: DNA helicase II [Colwellia sp.]|jgi:DNA helicase-2/ATP-dependent DNA helicase PcrA|nr:DNA helicase II [Colwellia sp.]|tara:strand:+ start:656 stop:2410 length:1755 start_codon:yes stop_codon:yes gene_type:complete